jgi:tetratricopeptide (TPR) repeat protein
LPPAERSIGDVTATAERAALLLLIRRKELGIPDDDAVAGVRSVAMSNAAAVPDAELVLRAIDAFPLNARGVGEEAAAQGARRDYVGTLRESAHVLADRWRNGEVSAYVYLSLVCWLDNRAPDELDAIVTRYARSTAIQYRAATCGAADEPSLRALLIANPRFHEADYFLGLSAVNADSDGSAHFARAWQGISSFTAARIAAAEQALTNEDFEECRHAALDVLRVVPGHSGAMLVLLEALSRLGQHPGAIAVGNTLAKGDWYLGDVNYWLAWNELRLGQPEAALAHAVVAQRYGASSKLWGLTGLIHAAQQDQIAARDAFQSAIALDSHDCGVKYHLGETMLALKAVAGARDAFRSAADCFGARSERLTEDIDVLSSDMTWGAGDDQKFRRLLSHDAEAAQLARLSVARAEGIR